MNERQLFAEGKSPEKIRDLLGQRSESVINGSFFSYPFYKIQKIAHKNSESPRIVAGVGNNKLLIYDIDFQSIIAEKQLVYLIGLIEGFILDSVRILYYTNEQYIEQHIVEPAFSTLRTLENFEELKIERIIQVTERKWGAGSFTTRFNKLQTKFGIDLEFHSRLIALFDEANLLRNCILHNGAKVSIDYYNFIGKSRGFNIGDKLNINRYFNESLYYLSVDFVTKLFCVVDSLSFQTEIGQLVYDHGYFKDVMLNEDNWIYQRLTEQGIY